MTAVTAQNRRYTTLNSPLETEGGLSIGALVSCLGASALIAATPQSTRLPELNTTLTAATAQVSRHSTLTPLTTEDGPVHVEEDLALTDASGSAASAQFTGHPNPQHGLPQNWRYTRLDSPTETSQTSQRTRLSGRRIPPPQRQQPSRVHSHVEKPVVPQSRRLETTTPAEPSVADAIARVLWHHNEGVQGSCWAVCIRTVSDRLLSRGLIDKGIKGEIFARLMCTLARDTLLAKEIPNHPEPAYSQPYLCSAFLQEITGIDLVARLAGNISDREKRIGHVELKSPVMAITKGYMNFTYFAHTDKSLPTNLPAFNDLLHGLLRQHCALQLSFGQGYWDLLLPVYCGDLGKNFDPSLLTAVFIQVKNRMHKMAWFLGTEYSNISSNLQPIIIVQMDLGLDHRDVEVKMRWPDLTKPSKDGGDGDGRYQGPYVLGARITGCTKSTFPFLTKSGLEGACTTLLKEVLPPASDLEQEICDRMTRFNTHSRREYFGIHGDDHGEVDKDDSMEDSN